MIEAIEGIDAAAISFARTFIVAMAIESFDDTRGRDLATVIEIGVKIGALEMGPTRRGVTGNKYG